MKDPAEGWEVTHAEEGSERLDRLLLEGWEPFAVRDVSMNRDRIYLRRYWVITPTKYAKI